MNIINFKIKNVPKAMRQCLPIYFLYLLFKVVPGGHMGLVSGNQAPQAVWPIVTEWLCQRSD